MVLLYGLCFLLMHQMNRYASLDSSHGTAFMAELDHCINTIEIAPEPLLTKLHIGYL